MAENKTYTTQLQAGLGMIQETTELLRLWQPNESPGDLKERVVASGVFSRTTARRARNLVIEMFKPRFLARGSSAAANLKLLVDANHNAEDLSQLYFLYTARAQAVFGDFVTVFYWPRYSAGSSTLDRPQAEEFLRRALDTGRMKTRWSDSVVRRVARYLVGTCTDFGLLGELRNGVRPIKRFVIRPNVALYLAHDLHFSSLSDLAVTRHPDWQLFGFDANEVLNQMKNLAHDGHFIIQATTDLVHIAWKYRSMEDCINAIRQR